MPKFNDLPQFFEELKLKEDATLSLQDLIANFKQQIPFNYLKIKLEEGNYCGSTNPKWKNKPLCERYGFEYERDWKQIDILHSLLEKLGLKKGENITQPLYLDPKFLDRTETYKGITIESEKEIILIDPYKYKITIKDQEVQTDLSSAKIKELENTIAEQTRQAQAKDKELADLRNQLTIANNTLNQKNTQIINLTNQLNNLQTGYNALNNQLITVRNELQKEQGWWDKWMNDGIGFVIQGDNSNSFFISWPGNNNPGISGRSLLNYWAHHEREFKEVFKSSVYRNYLK